MRLLPKVNFSFYSLSSETLIVLLYYFHDVVWLDEETLKFWWVNVEGVDKN